MIRTYCSEIGEISRAYPQPANGTSSYVDRVYVVWIGCGKCVQLGKTHGSFKYSKCCANLEIKGGKLTPMAGCTFCLAHEKTEATTTIQVDCHHCRSIQLWVTMSLGVVFSRIQYYIYTPLNQLSSRFTYKDIAPLQQTLNYSVNSWGSKVTLSNNCETWPTS